MPMHTVTQLLADADHTVTDLVIYVVQLHTSRRAARAARRRRIWARADGADVDANSTQDSIVRSITMLTQNNHSSSKISDRDQPSHPANAEGRCYAAIRFRLLDDQSDILDRVIHFAFDTLGARHLELRIYDGDEVATAVASLPQHTSEGSH
jgi:hypothetical protein